MHRSIAESLKEYARGIAGGLLFSLPLLYTMEMWQAGVASHPFELVIYVVVTYLLLLGYNRFAGLREDASFAEVAIDSIEEMGLGVVIAVVMLWLTGRIAGDLTRPEIVGQVAVEAMTVAIGVSVGTAQLGGNAKDSESAGATNNSSKQNSSADSQHGEAQPNDDNESFGGQLVIALCGAVLFAANVAPTEEIIVIAIESSVWKIIGLAVASLAFGGVLLMFSGFHGSDKFVRDSGASVALRYAVTTYAVALLASAAILFFFGRFDGQKLSVCVAQVVVLGVASVLGASAGRLLLQVGSQSNSQDDSGARETS